MPKKVLVGIGWILGVLIVTALAYATFIYVRSERILKTKYSVPSTSIVIPTDATSIARGEHLAHAVTSCVLCHGEGLGGNVYADMGASRDSRRTESHPWERRLGRNPYRRGLGTCDSVWRAPRWYIAHCDAKR